jgi:hypothetical protein
MKLRNRFLMIVIGTFLIPFILVVFTMIVIAPEFVYLGKNMHPGARGFFDNIGNAKNLEEIESLASHMPESFFIIVLDESNEVLFRKRYSTMTEVWLMKVNFSPSPILCSAESLTRAGS